jgi:hypothetical protein
MTTNAAGRRALYYPFHLCHERTLSRLLEDYESVHFRDYMALRLSSMSGTTAFNDRMGDDRQELVNAGRLVQGHNVSGSLDDEASAAVSRDLDDVTWRELFHAALKEDRRFQRGLFDLSHGMMIGNTPVPGPAFLLALIEESRRHYLTSVQTVARLSTRRLSRDEGYEYEYGLALVKTSASLVYTVRLSAQHGLEAVTDSEAHYRLFERTLSREGLALRNRWLPREGY